MNYFSQPKGVRELKPAPEPKFETPATTPAKADMLSTFGPGTMITGTVVCAGALQIFGRVSGEVHAAQLVVCEGAQVEGKIVAQDTVIQGEFKGTIHGNTVKLQASAVVDGEIYNRSLSIEQNAQFEGVSRRLERAIDTPSLERAASEAADRESYNHIEQALKDIVA